MNIKINGIHLHYEEFGSGEKTLIFLHGNNEDLHIFNKTINFFKDSYHVFAIDSRGHGSSELGKEPLSISLMAKDIEEFIETLNLKKITLIGFSDGANIALWLAAKNPSLIENLIAVGGNLYVHGLKTSVRYSITCMEFYNWCNLVSPERHRIRQVLRLMSKQEEITPEMLHAITARTLLITGENDMVKDSHTQEMKDNIKDSRWEVIKDGDHFLFMYKNEEINCLISDFIKSEK